MNGPDFQYDGLTAFAPVTNAATSTKKGLMAAADKAKLDTLEVPLVRLAYALPTNVTAGLVANTWADVVANQNFTVSSPTSLLLIAVNIGSNVTASALVELASRTLIDGGVGDLLGAAAVAAGGIAALGGGVVLRSGLAAGTHTIKIQVISSGAANFQCRPASVPNFEFATIRIYELNP